MKKIKKGRGQALTLVYQNTITSPWGNTSHCANSKSVNTAPNHNPL